MNLHPDTAAALNTMADHLDQHPHEPLTNSQRIELVSQLTRNTEPGVFDAVLVATAPIQLPQTRSDYAALVRDIARGQQ